MVYTPVLTILNMAQNQEEDDLLRMDFEEIINAVVVITHCYTQSFDEFEVGSGDATGFVVDITKG